MDISCIHKKPAKREKDLTRKEEHLVYTNNIRNKTGGKKK
jgi:hypothetical protein